jgi:hypothetical protein
VDHRPHPDLGQSDAVCLCEEDRVWLGGASPRHHNCHQIAEPVRSAGRAGAGMPWDYSVPSRYGWATSKPDTSSSSSEPPVGLVSTPVALIG